VTEIAKQRLDAHHGGAQFLDVMLRTFDKRFSEAFWEQWDAHVVPSHREAAAPAYADFGCGPGLMFERWRTRWPDAELHGVELQEYMLEVARPNADKAKATLHEQDLHSVRLPLPDGSLDAVLCAVVVHEMREPIGMLREIRRLLAPTGRLFLMDWVRVPLEQYLGDTEPDPFGSEASPEHRADRLDHFMEHNKFSRDDLMLLLERTGFSAKSTVTRGNGQFLWVVAGPQTGLPSGA